MKVFLVDFDPAPGAPECAVVIAATAEDAQRVVEDDKWLPGSAVTEITEVDMTEGIKYVGYYCC